MTKCKQRLYNKAKQTQSQADWDRYKQCKKDTTSAIRKAHNEYVEQKLIRGLEEGSTKPFWRYVNVTLRNPDIITTLIVTLNTPYNYDHVRFFILRVPTPDPGNTRTYDVINMLGTDHYL